MPEADWILTFDDGPLPSDITSYQPGDEQKLLAPLSKILKTLAQHHLQPIPAVFFLRGPGFPWKKGSKPPKKLYHRGVKMILDAGHHVAVHCFSHDPDLWWFWWLKVGKIHQDLDNCLEYFSSMAPHIARVFRPPYGQGGLAGLDWALDNNFRHRLWDIDSEDWLHHPELGALRRFAANNQAAAHLAHILAGLPLKMWLHTVWPGANDFLFHVNKRTARRLPEILDAIVHVTREQQHEPRFVVPNWFLKP